MTKTYSGSRIAKAGKQLIGDDIAARDEALEVLSYWRFSHEKPLDNALKLLQEHATAKDKHAIFAKRLKRYRSIDGKLRRFPSMSLKAMQDIGGARAIVSTTKQAKQIARSLKKRPEFKNSLGNVLFKNYVEEPKADGYRGYHLVGSFPDGAGANRKIELQIRTKLQHDWATTLEVVELFTGQALKSNRGSDDWKSFFRNVSMQFAVMEKDSLFGRLKPSAKFEAYGRQLLIEDENKYERIKSCLAVKKQVTKLNIVSVLEAFAHSLKMTDDWLNDSSVKVSGYVLLMVDTSDPTRSTVQGRFFSESDISLAEKEYAEIERSTVDNQSIVVALVSTTAVGGIREAFPNYFADSTDFLTHLRLIIAAPVTLPTENFLSGMFKRLTR